METNTQRPAGQAIQETREVELGGITYTVTSHFSAAMDIGPILERLALASVLEE